MLLAIDIGSKYIHIVEGRYVKKKLEVKRSKKVIIKPEWIVDGEISSPQEIGIFLKQFLKEEGFKSKRVALTFYYTMAISSEIVVPRGKKKEIIEVLRQEMSQSLMGDEEYIIDYGNVRANEEQMLTVSAVAIPERIICDYKEILEVAGLTPLSLTLHQNNIEKILNKLVILENNNVLVVDVGNSYMHLHLFNDLVRKFSRSTMINTEQYETTMVELEVLEENNENFYNIDLSFGALNRDSMLEETKLAYLNNIVRQIQNMMQFQMNLDSTASITDIYLCGGGANIKGLKEYIEESVDAQVHNISDLFPEGINYIPQISEYANTLGGLIITKEKEVNLFFAYKKEHLQRHNISRVSKLGGGLAIIQLVGVLGFMSIVGVMSGNAIKHMESIKAYLETPSMQQEIELLTKKREALGALQSYNKAIEELSTYINTWPKIDYELVSEIKKRISEGLTINYITYEYGRMSLIGEAETGKALTDYVYSLRGINQVLEVDYGGYNEAETGYSFNIMLTLKEGVYNEVNK